MHLNQFLQILNRIYIITSHFQNFTSHGYNLYLIQFTPIYDVIQSFNIEILNIKTFLYFISIYNIMYLFPYLLDCCLIWIFYYQL